jgi:hypothetical protein
MVFSDTTLNRFWSKVNKRGPNECWEWLGYIGTDGYGQFKVRPKLYRATRFSLILKTQKDDKDLFCLHSCDNPKCVNPNHLSWGNQKENMTGCLQRNKKFQRHCYHYGSNRFVKS